jgi:hypothetical protein
MVNGNTHLPALDVQSYAVQVVLKVCWNTCEVNGGGGLIHRQTHTVSLLLLSLSEG